MNGTHAYGADKRQRHTSEVVDILAAALAISIVVGALAWQMGFHTGREHGRQEAIQDEMAIFLDSVAGEKPTKARREWDYNSPSGECAKDQHSMIGGQ